ncbi:MAG: DHH family phosphoesterase [Pseudomonadales bacterium]
MADYDVFNGDADGICALIQLRHAEPRDSTIVTGVKRDIALLKKIDVASGDRVTVLDISMDKNKADLVRILDAGAEVFYCDHHFAGDIPEAPNLHDLINTEADTCTSLLVNGYLKGAYREWAVTAAFGDNLKVSALALAKQTSLSESEINSLENLGTYINYNGYGASPDDLHFTPNDLYTLMQPFTSPLDFIEQESAAYKKLEAGFINDMASARGVDYDHVDQHCAVLTFPNEAWARRVSGVFSNDLANENPDRAHAVLTAKANGNYLVSVRAPLNNKTGADELCMQFPTGGGRKAAAGINDLPAEMLGDFVSALGARYTNES